MMSMRSGVLLAVLLGFGAVELRSQTGPDGSTWDVTQAHGRVRQIDFTTSEGTWQSVDISPDGRWVVFDLLGHIYRVPATGGTAESLTDGSGVALNYHPRISPDGRLIAFVSDRDGQNNLWVMNVDGSDPRPVFDDPVTRITEPAWTPDGKAIVAVRHFPTYSMHRRSARIWRFPLDGPPEELAGAPSGWQAYWPSVSPDGRYLYYMYSTFAEPLHGRQRTQHIRRLDLETRATALVTTPEPERWYWKDGAIEMAPEISPDGRTLAFARRIPDAGTSWRGHLYQRRTALWLRDLTTGSERILMDPITLDMAEAHGMKNLRILPGYSWAKDGRSLVISQGGKLRRVWVADGRVETIPFTARVRRPASEQARSTYDIHDGPMPVKMIHHASSTGDGKTLVFEAVGSVWVSSAGGTPRRVSRNDSAGFEFTPALSSDGRWVAYATWRDGVGGHLWKAPLDGGAPVRLTTEPGDYLNPAWSADGQAVYAVRGTGAGNRGLPFGAELEFDLVRVPAAGGAATVLRTGVPPSGLSVDSSGRIYFVEQRGVGDVQVLLAEGKPVPETFATLVSVGPDGRDRREHVRLGAADEMVLSPDARWLAFRNEYNVFVAPIRATEPRYRAPLIWSTTSPIRLDPADRGDSVRQVSFTGGYHPRWRDRATLEFESGPRHLVYHLDTDRTDTIPITLTVPDPAAKGSVALTNARLVTIDHRAVIEHGTVIVRNGRIACVGKCSAEGVDRVINLSGTTILPGLVDVHAHHLSLGGPPDRMQHRYQSALYLAYGVTTVLDPSVESIEAFATAELVNAGRVLGPRTFTTGDALMPPAGSNGPATYQEMADMVNRLADWGAISIKFYLAPRRDQRQWVAEAARRRGLSVTNEGADLAYNLSCVLDGHTGWEHPMMYLPLYRDAAQLFGQAGAIYSPTLTVASAGYWAEEYWQSRGALWRNPKLRRFMPWERLVRTINTATRPLEEYSFPMMAEAVADMIRAGGYASLGGHGEQIGLDSHWEIRAYGQALTPIEALEVATMGGARMTGLDDDLGSITVGKVADLMILNSNPLEDLKRTTDIRYVMKAGRLYDAATLDEIWPDRRPYGPIPWANEAVFRGGVRPMDVWDHP